MSLACERTRTALSRRSDTLDEAERLRVEAHTGECADCREAAAMLSLARRIEGPTLSPDERQRISRSAIASASTRRSTPGPSLSRGRAVSLVAAIAALTTLVGLAVLPSWREGNRAPAPDVATSMAEAAISEPVQARLPEGEEVRLGPSLVRATTAATYTWDAARSTVHLLAGALHVETEPLQNGASFVVVTPDFDVAVVGTSFDVDLASITVFHGAVRVTPKSGAPRLVHQGEVWRLDASTLAVPSADTSATIPSASVASGAASSGPRGVANALSLLAEARRHLASRRAAKAQLLVDRVLAMNVPADVAAEAKSLRAECALVGGDPKEAERRYQEVAKEHGDLTAGETALYASARMAQQRGDKATAKKLLQAYLQRYPRGIFAKEARERLGELSR